MEKIKANDNQIDAMIKTKKLKYEQAEISGNKLSKSIIQRIIIARSIVNKPKLILLENHLDFIEDKQRDNIIDFLTDKSNGWTFIGISNNKYLQEKSDKIILMSNGEILK